MTPEQIITSFLQSEFTDEALAALRIDAKEGCVPYNDRSACLVAHSGGPLWGFRPAEEASEAYRLLGCNPVVTVPLPFRVKPPAPDRRRMKMLIPIIDAEIARRAAARAEVVERAKEVITQPSRSLLSIQQAPQRSLLKEVDSVSSELGRALLFCHEDRVRLPNR